ncbi:MAG: tyrosine-type recombinase/integrase [Polyangiales bacterium]
MTLAQAANATAKPEDGSTNRETPRFAAFAQEWLETYVRVENRASTYAFDEKALRVHLIPRIGDERLDAITPQAVAELKRSLVAHGLAPKTVNNYLGVLHVCLATAHEWGLVGTVPCIRKLSVPNTGYKYLTGAEVSTLLASLARGYWRTLVMFVLHTGARSGETAGLRWSDVDLDAEHPSVTFRLSSHVGAEDPTKTNTIRVVPITRELREELYALDRENPLVFARPDGRPADMKNCGALLKRSCARAGVRQVSWHPLRHTYATDLTASGVSLRVVQELLGHSTIEMTMRYAHVAPTTMRDSVDKLSYAGRTFAPSRHQSRHQQQLAVDSPEGDGISGNEKPTPPSAETRMEPV